MNTKWRLILDGKHDGYYNMAVDEAILLSYHLKKIPTLRIYGWDKPFISLGYNQQTEKVLTATANIPFVRRITGGASILHDKEITYSITCCINDLNLTSKVKESYEKICSFLKEFYKRLGLTAVFAKDIYNDRISRHENFCFSSYEPFDLIVDGKKIGGNAQRRKHKTIFQHGSIPQEIDFVMAHNMIKTLNGAESKAASLNNLIKQKTDFYQLGLLLKLSFQSVFGIDFSHDSLFEDERVLCSSLLESKYSQKNWNINKNQAYR